MSYPLSGSFATVSTTSYTIVLDGMSATHGSAQQFIGISTPNNQFILRFNEAVHGDFWFEANIELLTDLSARKRVGLWMIIGSSSESYRFTHFDGGWSVSHQNSDFGDGARMIGGVNDGARSIAGLVDVAPTLNVGQRSTLRCEVIVSALDANGAPWARLIRFKVNGVLMFQVGDVACRGKLTPGVFLYGTTAHVHTIAGDTPSGSPAFLTTAGVNVDDDLLPLVGDSTSVPPSPTVNIGVNTQVDLSRLNNPSSNYWNRGSGYGWQFHSIPDGRKNIHLNGHGSVVGMVKKEGQPDQPLARRVQLTSENVRVLVAETQSDIGGNYQFGLLDPAQ